MQDERPINQIVVVVQAINLVSLARDQRILPLAACGTRSSSFSPPRLSWHLDDDLLINHREALRLKLVGIHPSTSLPSMASIGWCGEISLNFSPLRRWGKCVCTMAVIKAPRVHRCLAASSRRSCRC